MWVRHGGRWQAVKDQISDIKITSQNPKDLAKVPIELQLHCQFATSFLKHFFILSR